MSYYNNNYHCCNSRAVYNDHLHFHFPIDIYSSRNLHCPGQNLKQKKQDQNQNVRILNMKIMMTIVMKNTKASQYLRYENKQLYATVV